MLAPPGLYLCLTIAAILYAIAHNSDLGYEGMFLFLVTLPWSGTSLRWPALIGSLINLAFFFALGFCLAKTLED
jgi:hypothetical protein